MLSNIGNSLITINLFLTLSIIYVSANNLKNYKVISSRLFKLSLYQTTVTIMSFFTLITGFIISDFSLTAVFQNSHTLKPLFYKISGSWGNHEGSLLLWINVLVIFSYLFLLLNKKSNNNYKILTLLIQNILIFGFLLFLFANSNPFSLIVPAPLEGMGLNPILQDPALAIHPPMLYIGFVGSSIYFSAAISSLLSEYKGKSFAQSIRPWVLVSWSFQTLGIIIGSIWAYYELGWGGFWFWDPVENASLMPWFAMTALLHSLTVLQNKNALYSWVIVLCLSTFTLSVTGTFLVRSGVLNSVHTFASDPSRGLYILIFLSLMIFSSLFIYLKKSTNENYRLKGNSRETFILVNNWFMAFFLFTVLIGTVYPIFTEVISNTKISLGPPFYNIVIIPIIIPFLFFMALAPNLQWTKKVFTLIIILALASFLNLAIIYFFKKYSLLSNLIVISSIFLIIYSAKDLLSSLKNKSFPNLSRIFSHLGFGLLIFFISINHNFTIEEDFNLKVGDKKKFENYSIHFVSLKTDKKQNYKSITGIFNINNLNSLSTKELTPEIRIYSQPETLTYEASIRSGLTHDLYLTMSNISRTNIYNIKFQKKPFMLWIWISAIMISVGGFLRIFKNER